MKYGKKILLLPIFLFLGLFAASVAFAQNPNYDVTVSPVFFDLSSNPGSTISDKIRIRNNTSSPIAIKLEVQKLTADANGDVTLKPDTNDETLTWVKFQNQSFIASPLEWSDIPFTIQVPKSAAFGYYFAITFKRDDSAKAEGVGAAISGAAAVPVLLNVRSDGAKSEAKIVKFETKNFISDYLPIDFNARVANSGNVHVAPHGNIFITDWTGKNVGDLEVNSSFGNIIPDTERTFLASWIDGFLVNEPLVIDGQTATDKNGNPKTNLSIKWDKLTSFRFGKYNANLILVYDDGQRDVSIEKSISFWVIPYKALLVFLVVLIAFIFLIRATLRYYVGKEINKRTKS